MKNAGMAGAVALVGVGLITIGLGNFVKAPQALAASAAAISKPGPEEPRIVWYQSFPVTVAGGAGAGAGNGGGNCCTNTHQVYHEGPGFMLVRAWSTGEIEARFVDRMWNCDAVNPCRSEWEIVSSPNEGFRAQADVNFDEVVDGADMGLVLGNWGPAPRSPIPASDCPLGLMQ